MKAFAALIRNQKSSSAAKKLILKHFVALTRNQKNNSAALFGVDKKPEK